MGELGRGCPRLLPIHSSCVPATGALSPPGCLPHHHSSDKTRPGGERLGGEGNQTTRGKRGKLLSCVSQQAILHPAPIRHPVRRQSLVKMACAGVSNGLQVQSALAQPLSRPSSDHDQVVDCKLVRTLACHRSGGDSILAFFLAFCFFPQPLFLCQPVDIYKLNHGRLHSILLRPERPLWVPEATLPERCLGAKRGTVGRRYHQNSPLPRTLGRFATHIARFQGILGDQNGARIRSKQRH